jgi:hypothetical protein
MWRPTTPDFDDRAVNHQILAFLDEYCRGMTLQDVREWYVDAFSDTLPSGRIDGIRLNAP